MPVTPTFSIVLPFRNAAATLDDAFASVVSQGGSSTHAMEILAVDAHATDDSASRVEVWARRDARIRRIGAPEPGLAAAVRAGVAAARGAFVARIDAEDVSLPGRFAAQHLALDRDRTLAAVGGGIEVFGDQGFALGTRRFSDWQNGLRTADDHARALFIAPPICSSTMMFRRAALDRVGGYRAFDGPEDYDLCLRFDEAGYGMAKLDRPVLRWRYHGGRDALVGLRFRVECERAVKAPHLARRLATLDRPVVVWGAGRTGKRLARALEPFGVPIERFVDVDPHKVGGVARGRPIAATDSLRLGHETVLVAVGARGARDAVRARLASLGAREGHDFLCGG